MMNLFIYLKEKVKNQFIIDYSDSLAQLLLKMRSTLIYDKEYTLETIETILSQLDALDVGTFNQIIEKRFSNLEYSLFQFV